jgi:undecaprenyl-diphosphatase
MNDFLKKRLSPNERYGLRVTLMAIAFLIVVIPFGLLLSEVSEAGAIPSVDSAVSKNLHEWVRGSPALVNFWQGVSLLGSPAWFYVLVGVAAAVMMKQGHPRLALFLIATGLLGGILDSIVKIVVDRPRPTFADPVATAHGMSFPSGHSMAVTVNYGALLLVFLPAMAKKWRLVAWITAIGLILAVGVSRLVLGVHFVTDVLGGYLLGLAWLALSTAAFSIWRVERGKTAVEPQEGLAPEAF